MKGTWFLLAVTVIVIAIAAGAISRLRESVPEPAPNPATQTEPAPTQLSLPARIQGHTVVDVPVTVSGRIEAVHADVGAEVYEGQLLAQIRNEGSLLAQQTAVMDLERAQARVNNLESSIAAAMLEASRASADASRGRSELDRASRNYERQKMLLAEGATPRLVFEKAEREFRSIEEESKNLDEVSKHSDERVANLQRELDNARRLLQGKTDDLEHAGARLGAGDIYSPVSGTISARRAEVGQEVDPSLPDLFRIATDLSVLEAVVEPTPEQLTLIKPGQEATIAVAELPGALLLGVVKSAADGRVYVEFSNPNPLVRPGLTAQVNIKLT